MARVTHPLRYWLFALSGVVAGAIDFALGAHLASPENGGWTNAMYYSAGGLVGAPLACLSWATHRLTRSQIFAGIAVLIGFAGSMALLLDLTEEHSSIVSASSRAPFESASWLVIWCLWISLAVTRLILFSPEHTRRRLTHRHRHAR